MSRAEYPLASLPVISKLAALLLAAVQPVWAKVVGLLRGDNNDEPLINSFLDASPAGVAKTASNVPCLHSSCDLEITWKPLVDQSDREQLIRRRWSETGSRLWNPNVHGTGQASLNIQGSVALLPPNSGEMLPRYDKLEFKLTAGCIICEGVVVEPPIRPGRPGMDLFA